MSCHAALSLRDSLQATDPVLVIRHKRTLTYSYRHSNVSVLALGQTQWREGRFDGLELDWVYQLPFIDADELWMVTLWRRLSNLGVCVCVCVCVKWVYMCNWSLVIISSMGTSVIMESVSQTGKVQNLTKNINRVWGNKSFRLCERYLDCVAERFTKLSMSISQPGVWTRGNSPIE